MSDLVMIKSPFPFDLIIDSSKLSAVLASPPAISNNISKLFTLMFLAFSSISLSSAVRIISFTCSFVNSFSLKTLHLLRSAEFTSKDGFSVVAPIKIISPFSTECNNESCCALLNL